MGAHCGESVEKTKIFCFLFWKIFRSCSKWKCSTHILERSSADFFSFVTNPRSMKMKYGMYKSASQQLVLFEQFWCGRRSPNILVAYSYFMKFNKRPERFRVLVKKMFQCEFIEFWILHVCCKVRLIFFNADPWASFGYFSSRFHIFRTIWLKHFNIK